MEAIIPAVFWGIVLLWIVRRLFRGSSGGRRSRPGSEQEESQIETLERRAQARREELEARRRELGETSSRMPSGEPERLGSLRDMGPGGVLGGSGASASSQPALKSPWIEEHEVPEGFPNTKQATPEAPAAPPRQEGRRRAARWGMEQAPESRGLLRGLATRRGLRQAILAREILGQPKGLRPPGEDSL